MVARPKSPTEKSKVNVPKVIRLVRILDAQVECEEPTAIISVTSEKGFSGIRVTGRTKGTEWSVDLYGGNLYIVKVVGYESESRSTPIEVVNLLKARLPHV